MKIILVSILTGVWTLFAPSLFAKTTATDNLIYPASVNIFFASSASLTPFLSAPASIQSIRAHFIGILDSSAYLGLNKDNYHYAAIESDMEARDSLTIINSRPMLIDAIIAISKDLYQGAGINQWIKNDEISSKYAATDDGFLVTGLSSVNSIAGLDSFLASIEPKDASYKMLKNELKTRLTAGNTENINQLETSLNFYRWVHHFKFNKYILVNIAAAELQYFENDNVQLKMKVVVGKTATKTPFLSTYCNQVVLYPYWNVPKNIGNKELLAKMQKNPQAMDEMNIDLLDEHGAVVDHNGIDFTQYTNNNFPYTFRQATGCSNALGVIKFNLTDPFDIYLHDTNLKEAFEKPSRFLSHGCIRLEKPLDLANFLLPNKVDESFVLACKLDQKPVVTTIKTPVPVFIIYMTAAPAGDTVAYYKDVYHVFNH
jgi:murein L,D-transpeptidase YcbB/YkuD